MGKKGNIIWLQLTSVGIQIGVTIFVLSWLGKYIDAYFGYERPWFAVSLSILGMLMSMWLLFKLIKKINK